MILKCVRNSYCMMWLRRTRFNKELQRLAPWIVPFVRMYVELSRVFHLFCCSLACPSMSIVSINDSSYRARERVENKWGGVKNPWNGI